MEDAIMSNAFVLRADERGYNKILSTGPTASYVGGHPDAFITRFSSFNFGEYQDGRPGLAASASSVTRSFTTQDVATTCIRTTTSLSARSCWRGS
jgi:hypothetical protein